ncbi:MAG: undecaprenyl-diphosphate phosphatase [Oscillospiraceae bacterium]|nr:undecaprenyl-diphosphate phosphatase [Oscillospiraceae bacterium]
MNIVQAAILGALHGITTVLPISGSGHISALRELLKVGSDDPLFVAMLWIGILIAVCFFYRRNITVLGAELLRVLHIKKQRERSAQGALQRRLLAFLLIGTIPMSIALFCRDLIGTLSGNLFFIAFAMMVNGGIIFTSDRFGRGAKTARKMTVADAVWIGFAQLFSLLPGLSRTGLTVATGMTRGLDKRFSADFSFLLSVPALLGAVVMSLTDAFSAAFSWNALLFGLIGMVLAAVFAYGALLLIHRTIRRETYNHFAFYCWGAGAVILFLALIS